MRAVIIDSPGRMRIGEWNVPTPKPGEVLISVAAAGVCAGDMYCYYGKNPYVEYPMVLGHEISGYVEAVGEGVTTFQEGDRVVVEPCIGCGTCYPCRVGKPNCCANLQIIGVHRPGGYAERLTAPATHLHQIPDNLSMELATFAEPLAVGVHACRRGEVGNGEYVLILGCGPIGLAIIEAAKARGARIVVADMLESRLEMGRKLGAETLVAGPGLLETVLAQTNGEGAPVVIEATGNPRAMEATVDLVASGGRIVIVGLLGKGVGVTLPGLDFTRKEMTILGSRASSDCFPESLQLLKEGKITFPSIASEFRMWNAPQVFADLAANPSGVHKAVFIRE